MESLTWPHQNVDDVIQAVTPTNEAEERNTCSTLTNEAEEGV